MLFMRTVGWLACVIYSTVPLFWLMVHPFADRWRKNERSPFRVLVPAWIGMWIVVSALTSPWRGVTLYSALWAWLPAALLFSLGVYIYSRASAHFSLAQLGGLPEVRSNHQDDRLITTGIRARVRHPIYLAHLCEMVAWSVGTGLVVCWMLTALAVAAGAVMIRMEDVELEKRFGEEFRKYRSTVGTILPRSTLIPNERPRLSCDGIVVCYEFQGHEVWRFALTDLVCIGEYTNANGPWLDDYFLVFGVKNGVWYEASLYSDGRDATILVIGRAVDCELNFGLVRSSKVATRILWPKELEGEPLFVGAELNSEVRKLVAFRQL